LQKNKIQEGNMRRSLTLLATFIVVALALGACASQSLTANNVWARPGIAGGNGAVYMTISNPG
jgi:hypothetical protein